MAANKKPLLNFLVIFLSLIFSSLLVFPAASSFPEKLSFDSIYQFGDSLSDTGNLIRENPVGSHTPFGRFPYGITLNQPTGRCSDGLLMIDYFAKFFQLPLLSPYLNQEGNFSHGVNFAVAGSTALDATSLLTKGVLSPVTNSSLSVQLKWFKSHLTSTCKDALECQIKVRRSLVIMGEVGGNDYNYALLERKPIEELQRMVPDVVQAIKIAVKEVIDLGAIRIVVPGNFPIGCMPIYLATFDAKDPTMYDELKCLKGLNDFAKFHNDLLQQAIKELQEEHPNVAIVYGDYFNGLRWILSYAPWLGFEQNGLQEACCGTGNNAYNFNMTQMCGTTGAKSCANPAMRFSWDGIHLTQHAYFHMAQWLLKRIIPGILQVA